MKQLKVIALISFIVTCLTITSVNLSTKMNAEPVQSPYYGDVGQVKYETKTINGHTVLFVKFGDDIEVVKL